MPSALPTTPPSLTQAGTILGTFQYMAPEQIEGEEADGRTDIFAFGAVLYETLTGRKAFTGKTQASLLGAILKDEPPPIATLQPLTPPALEHVVKTCLAKDPDDRWQTAGDLRRQLQWVVEGGSLIGLPQPEVKRRKKRQWLVSGLVGSLAGAVATGALVWIVTRPAAPPPQRLSIVLPAEETVSVGCSPCSSVAISPDGAKVVYLGRTSQSGASGEPVRAQLYVRTLGDRSVRALPGTEGAQQPFFSPDGQRVGFATRSGQTIAGISGVRSTESPLWDPGRPPGRPRHRSHDRRFKHLVSTRNSHWRSKESTKTLEGTLRT